MTDPVAILVENRKTGDGHLVASDGTGYALPITVTAQGGLSAELASNVEAFWRAPGCLTQVQLTEDGQATQVSGLGKTSSGLPISGRVQLLFHYVQLIDGEDCETEMQAVLDCHQDSNLCGGATTEENQELQQNIQELFAPYVDAGAMTVQDIPSIRVLSFTARYE
jgi:hypothetical protein